MRAVQIDNGIVINLLEVPSLTAFDGMTLITAPDNVGMGWSYDGTDFTAPALTAEEVKNNTNNMAKSYLNETDWYLIRELDGGTAMTSTMKQLRADARTSVIE